MKKRISFYLIAFALCFMCFSYNANAEVKSGFDYDYVSFYNSLTEEHFTYFDTAIRKYMTDNNVYYSVCHVVTSSITDSLFSVRCYRDDIIFDNLSYMYSYVYGIRGNFTTSIFRYEFNNLNLVFNNDSSGSVYGFFPNESNKNYDVTWPFWINNDVVYNGELELSMSDDVYNALPSRYKEHYDFQDYLYNGKPIYSISNLVLGNWKGYTANINLTYCIDNVCDDTIQKTLSYKYGSENDVIDLNSEIDEEYNGYKLDNTKTYTFNANSVDTLKIYYYSTDLEYKVNYYFDDELNEELSYTKTAPVYSVIILDNLEDVIDSIYFLDKEIDYTLTITNDKENVINVYYKSYDMNYSVNVYLDDIYYQSHSYVGTAKLGSEVILENLSEIINIYTLDTREYKLSISENSQMNYINVYYYSDNYETKYQDIDTSGKFYISFDWVYIKELFSLNGNYTQTEQFIIVYVVNFLFYAIVVIVGYFALKMINKLISLLKMF